MKDLRDLKEKRTMSSIWPKCVACQHPRRSLSLQLINTRVYEPQKRARLGTTAHKRTMSSIWPKRVACPK